MSKTLYGACGPIAPPADGLTRQVAASVLRNASRVLARLARRVRVGRPGVGPQIAPQLEFYCEAGAPEGALYVDGELVGHVPGVSRL